MMLFFDTMLFFDLISVNPLLVADGVTKITALLFFASLEVRQCKLLTSCQKIHRPSVNRFDEVIVLVRFGQLEPKCKVMDRVY